MVASETKTKALAIFAVTALHVVFVCVLQRMRAYQSERAIDAHPPLILISAERPREPERASVPAVEANVSSRAPQREHERAPDSSVPDPVPAMPAPPRAIDWRANAARSAELVVGASVQEGHRKFGPREPAPREGAEVRSVFPETPKQKFGAVGDDAHGDPIVWLSEHCYMTLDKRVQTARDWVKEAPGKFAPAETVCLYPIGRRQPDGTLFEHIEQREEPPVPKAGTEMNPLPEREDEKREMQQ